jgi:hypothetical protein
MVQNVSGYILMICGIEIEMNQLKHVAVESHCCAVEWVRCLAFSNDRAKQTKVSMRMLFDIDLRRYWAVVGDDLLPCRRASLQDFPGCGGFLPKYTLLLLLDLT